MHVKRIHGVLLVLPGLILALALFVTRCGGGGGSSLSPDSAATSDSAATAGDAGSLEAPGTSDDTVKLITGEPGAPVLESGAPVTAKSVMDCPPPAGASANNTINAYYKPANAFDGKMNTWWVGHTAATNWDLYYGFPAARDIESVSATFYGAGYVPGTVNLRVSSDGCSWSAPLAMRGAVKPEAAVGQSVQYLWIEMSGAPAAGYPLIRDIDWTPPRDNVGASGGPGANEAWYFPANAFDGDTSTWWVGQVGAGAWDLYYMFEAPRTVQMVTAEMFNGNYRPASMTLSVSLDGQAWTDLGEMGPGAWPSQFVGQAAQYIHIQMAGNPPSNFPLIKDITFDIPDGASSGDSVSAFYKPANAFDSNPGTWWAGAPGRAKWDLLYKFTAPTFLGSVDIAYYAAGHTPGTTTLFISNDGETWTDAGAFPSGANPVLPVNRSVTYVRIHMSGAPATGFPLIKDAELNPGTCTYECITDADCSDADTTTTDTCTSVDACSTFCENDRVVGSVISGLSHSCVVYASGGARCWGRNVRGALGHGDFVDSATPVGVVGLDNIVKLAIGDDHTCAVLSGGAVSCWGLNDHGQLGDGTTANSAVPRTVPGITDAVDVTAGAYHTCALHSGGTVSCWGNNADGNLGLGTFSNSVATPVLVPGLTGVASLHAGYHFTCALMNGGSIKCWGRNDFGQLGNGNTSNAASPVDVAGVTGALDMSSDSYHVCAIMPGATLKCWGWNQDGQLGLGYFGGVIPTATAVPALANVVDVECGYRHVCALLSGGGVKCWGNNEFDRLGTGDATPSATPVDVPGVSQAVQLSGRGSFNCVYESDGDLKCWGMNLQGQLGAGTIGGQSTTPVAVIGY